MFPLWFLCDASTVQEKIDYLRACHAGGINGMVMTCLPGNQTPYLSNEWFRMIRALVDEGARLGMQMWLYDEDPLPSGGASGLVMLSDPSLYAAAMVLREAPADLRPGRLWFIGDTRVIWAGLVPLGGEGPSHDLTAEVGTVSADWFMVRWNSKFYGYDDMPEFEHTRGDAVWQRFALHAPPIPPGYKLVAVTAEQSGHYRWAGLPNVLNPAAFGHFRRLVLDKYTEFVGEHFGKTVPGIFTDEPSVGAAWTPFTPDLFETFEKTWGYDLRPRLFQLFGKSKTREFLQTRIDYRRLISRRFLDSFLRPYRRWCEDHGLLLIGHVSPEDDPVLEAACCQDMLSTMKSMSLPGTDTVIPYPGLNLGSLRAASMRAQTGRPYAISESLALSGWGVTSEKCRQLLAVQQVLGIDRFSLHAFFSSSEGLQNYQVPPEYGPGSSIFAGICILNDWLKATEALTDGATEVADVAIVDSIAAYWTGAPGDADRNEALKAMRKGFWAIINSCLAAHVGIHVVGDEDLGAAQVADGRVTVGERAYRCFLVPPVNILSEAAVRKLAAAAEAGLPVYWFGGGPRRVTDADGRLMDAAALTGTILRAAAPSDAWCRAHLPHQVRLAGKESHACHVRRFRAKSGADYLLAVNLEEHSLILKLPGEDGRVWLPERVDGETAVAEEATSWQVPARCCGLFKLRRKASPKATGGVTIRRETGHDRRFTRLSPNLLRLNRPQVSRPGMKPRVLDYPLPYWELFKDYTVLAPHHAFSYSGAILPVESTVPESALRYTFRFAVDGEIKAPALVLDPRCARGRFRLLVNGRPLGGERSWPPAGIAPARVRLPGLNQGANTLELHFEIGNAMEGLLSQLYLEGDFDLDIARRTPVLRPPTHAASPEGWQASGLPHYMGAGKYSWSEVFTEAELDRPWTIHFDSIVDSAEFFVNGESQGSRAWAPWEWRLTGLRKGRNRFDLVVHGTAGNKHELDYPAQPQGWIGAALLLGSS
jgi:hypothetical protein